MNFYRVTTGCRCYTMRAPNIQAASQFVRHWPSVTVSRIVYPFNPRPQWHKNLPHQEY